jgi:gliding motility-associated protein GldL
MGKYRRYKNKIEMFLSSEGGKRLLNFCYSWGASVVVVGAMFKLVHLPYANQILCVSLIIEAVVFFISAFERPMNEYHWDEVFPVLKSKNPLDRPGFGKEGGVAGGIIAGGGATIMGGEGIGGGGVGGTVIIGNIPQGGATGGSGGGGTVVIGGGGGAPAPRLTPEESASAGLKTMGLNVSEEDAQTLAASIKKLGEAADQIAKMADMTDATQSYIEQITTVAQNLERFNVVTHSLSEVSDSLVHSCKAISGSENEENPEDKTPGYVQQMEHLNENLSGLNKFYEVQLNGLRSQMDTIHHINAGLSRIRDMYDSSVVDSSAFRAENERMAQLLGQLNQVYSRLLQAMTVNTMPYPPQQPPYQNVYQQPPYTNPIR